MIKKSLFFSVALCLLAAALFYSCADELSMDSQDVSTLKKAQVTNGLTPLEQLGKELFFDKISDPGSMACADCHAPKVGFTGPIAGINLH